MPCIKCSLLEAIYNFIIKLDKIEHSNIEKSTSKTKLEESFEEVLHQTKELQNVKNLKIAQPIWSITLE